MTGAPDIRAADEASWTRGYRLVDPESCPHMARHGGEPAAVTDEQIHRARAPRGA